MTNDKGQQVTGRGAAGASARLPGGRLQAWSRGVCGGSFLLVFLFSTAGRAQSRLEQLEATYQANLRTLHAPVLQDYLRQLELLKSLFTARNRVADSKQVDEEIARVKSIMSTTGVLPYTELEAALASPTDTGPSKTPAPPAKGVPATLPTLLAAEAFKGAEISGKTGAIPLGSAEWRISKLPAGTYDLLIIFASEALPKEEQVTVNLGGHEFQASVASDRATGSLETFRLLRLCQIKLDAEVSGGTLNLTAASQDKPLLWVKKVMFSTPKKGAPGGAPPAAGPPGGGPPPPPPPPPPPK